MPTLYNLNHNNVPPSAVYIGRTFKGLSSEWGNPFRTGKDGTLDDVLFKHWQMVHRDRRLLARIRHELVGKDLACFCHPDRCHGDTLIQVANAPDLIPALQGEYRFLSNFHPCPIRTKSGLVFPSSEHAYQAFKTTNQSTRRYFTTLPEPGDAKRLGKTLVLRRGWNEMRPRVMLNILRAKFFQNLELGMRLVNTCDAKIVEGNWWGDKYFGVCNGIGENVLGLLLMQVRHEVYTRYCKGRT